MKKVYLILLFLISFLNFGQSRDLLHLAYGKAPQQNLDLYLPEKKIANAPVVIMLHGGAWSMGGLEYTTKHCQDLRNNGLIVANVDYRYVSDSLSAKDLLSDIDAAVNYVSSLSIKYGFAKKGYHIVGISAGAHLALLYGYTKKNMRSITALCAPSRLDSPEALEFVKKNGHLEIVEMLAGTKLNEKGVNPAFVAISPFNLISNTPTFLIHGDADQTVNVSLSLNLYAELQRKGVESKLEIRQSKGHDVGMNTPETEKQNISDISAWITQHNN